MKTVFDMQLPAVLSFVKQSCHENLHDTLCELRDIANHNDLASIQHVASFVKDFIRRLQYHLALEENNLFPLIEMQKKETNIFPIHHLLDDHDEFDTDLTTLRTMTNNFEIRTGISETCLRFYRKLVELERIILNHIQIENQILFPLVLKIS
jgi:iron-sulfur cluster repair protein YtfE (RIC family)